MAERFTLLTELGRGGMGVVWKALDEETGQIVALKLLRETYAEDPDYVTRFERELELAKRIHSAHVVEVIGFGARDGVPYLALEFVDGPSLRDLLKDHGPYAWPEAKDLLIQITQGLADAHAAGVIHRDLKPSNILIGPDSVAKLADFGIAKGLDLTRVTGTPTLLGTPAYLAPEGPIDERSDLYSLGIIAYELLTAAAPFAGSTYQEVIVRHIRETPDLAKLPSEARDIVAWLLAKEPAQRPQRASQLMAALYGAGPGPGPAAAAASGPYQPTAPAPLPPATLVARAAVPAPDGWPAQIAPTVVMPTQTVVIPHVPSPAAGYGQQPGYAGRHQAAGPTRPAARRSPASLGQWLTAVGLVVLCLAVVGVQIHLQGATANTVSSGDNTPGSSALSRRAAGLFADLGARLDKLTSYQFAEEIQYSISGGVPESYEGVVVNQPTKAYSITAPDYRAIVVGDRGWESLSGGSWESVLTGAGAVTWFLPSADIAAWFDAYGADFQPVGEETKNGLPCLRWKADLSLSKLNRVPYASFGMSANFQANLWTDADIGYPVSGTATASGPSGTFTYSFDVVHVGDSANAVVAPTALGQPPHD